MASGNKAFFMELDSWVDGLEDVQGLAEFSNDLGRASQALMRDGFRTGTDPSGSKWKPKREGDGRKPLTGKTGRLSKPWRLMSDRHGFRLRATVPYASYHQNGSKGGQLIVPKNKKALRFKSGGQTVFSKGVKRGDIPKRKMYPDGPNLPRKWSREYEQEWEDFCSSKLRSKA